MDTRFRPTIQSNPTTVELNDDSNNLIDRLNQEISDAQSLSNIEVVDDEIISSRVSDKQAEVSTGLFSLAAMDSNQLTNVSSENSNTSTSSSFSKKRSISESSVEKMAGSSKRTAGEDDSAGENEENKSKINPRNNAIESSALNQQRNRDRSRSNQKDQSQTKNCTPGGATSATASSELIDLTYSDDEDYSDEGDLSEDLTFDSANATGSPSISSSLGSECSRRPRIPPLLTVRQARVQSIQCSDFEPVDEAPSRPSCMLNALAPVPAPTVAPTVIASSSLCSFNNSIASNDSLLHGSHMNPPISNEMTTFWHAERASLVNSTDNEPRTTHQAPIPSPVLTPTLDSCGGGRGHHQPSSRTRHHSPYPPTPSSNPRNLANLANLASMGATQGHHSHPQSAAAVNQGHPLPPPPCHQYSCPHAMCNCHSHCPFCAQHPHSSSVVADVVGMGGHQQRYFVNCELHSPCPGHCPHSTHGSTLLVTGQPTSMSAGGPGQSAVVLPTAHQHYHHHLPCSRTPVICPAMTGYPMSVAAMSFYPPPPPQPQMIDVHHHHYVHPNDPSVAAAAAASLVSSNSLTLTLSPQVVPPPPPNRGQSPVALSTSVAPNPMPGAGSGCGSGSGPVPPLSQQRLLQRQQDYISRSRDAQARWYEQRSQQQHQHQHHQHQHHQRASAAAAAVAATAAAAHFLPYHQPPTAPNQNAGADPGTLGAAAMAAAAASSARATQTAIYYHPYSAAVTPSFVAAAAAAAHTTAAVAAATAATTPPLPWFHPDIRFDARYYDQAAAGVTEAVVGRSVFLRPQSAAVATALAAAGLQQMWTTSVGVGPYVLVDRTFPLESQFLRHMAESMDLPQGASSLLIEQCTTSCNYKVPDEKPVAGEEEKCPVCLCEFENDERVRSLPCAHLFHVDCIDRWLGTNKKCPVCRLNIDRYRQQQQQQAQQQPSQQTQTHPPPLVTAHRHYNT